MQLPPPPTDYGKRMHRCEEATELCVVGLDAFGREVRLTPDAADAWIAMQNAAKKENIHILLISGFRSIVRQVEILKRKIERGADISDILKVNAYPGYSEHHTGRAVDIGSPNCEHLTEAFEKTREFAWLGAHAASFGFSLSHPRSHQHGILFEPWHWYMNRNRPNIRMVRTSP